MKIVVINSKGGVGKSTISVQVIASYLYQKSDKQVPHYEFDDENEDNKAYTNSQILKTYTQPVAKVNLSNKLTDILLDENDCIIDVGANKTTIYFLEALFETGMIYTIDLFVIPLMDGESDAMSALRIYEVIKEANSEAKVMFALNRVNSNRELTTQFDIFLGDDRGIFNQEGIIESIDEADRNYIVVYDSDIVKYSKSFGITILELSLMDRDLASEIKEAIKNKEDKQTIKILSFKKSIKDNAVVYYQKYLKSIFIQLDKLLGNSTD